MINNIYKCGWNLSGLTLRVGGIGHKKSIGVGRIAPVSVGVGGIVQKMSCAYLKPGLQAVFFVMRHTFQSQVSVSYKGESVMSMCILYVRQDNI